MSLTSLFNFCNFFLCFTTLFPLFMESRLMALQNGLVSLLLLQNWWPNKDNSSSQKLSSSEEFASGLFLWWKQRRSVTATQLECNLLVVQLSVLSLANRYPHRALDILLHLCIVTCAVPVELKYHSTLPTVGKATHQHRYYTAGCRHSRQLNPTPASQQAQQSCDHCKILEPILLAFC